MMKETQFYLLTCEIKVWNVVRHGMHQLPRTQCDHFFTN